MTKRKTKVKWDNMELTNADFAALKQRVIRKHPGRMHEMEWDCTGNEHAGDCWCTTETYALAKKLGYRV